MRLAALIVLLCTASLASPSRAQDQSPKWKKECREKAIAAGLWTKGKGRANHVANKMLKDERKAFMRKCKQETVGALPASAAGRTS